MSKCEYNYNCPKCEAPDCTFNGILPEERLEMKERDIKFMSYGVVHKGRPQKAKNRSR